MAAEIIFLNSDAETELTSLHLGTVGSGQKYSQVHGAPKKLHVQNSGDIDFCGVSVQLQQVDADIGIAWATLYPDSGSSANLSAPAGQDEPVSLGELPVSEIAPFHLDVEVPPAPSGERLSFSLYVIALI